MKNWKQNIIEDHFSIKQALERLNEIGIPSNVLYVVDEQGILLGSLTDGDIRRGLLKDAHLDRSVVQIMNRNCVKVSNHAVSPRFLEQSKQMGVATVPVVDDKGRVVEVLTIADYIDMLPVDAVIMAGGKGERLMPLTKDCPKPLLPVGDKPIIEHNLDRLIKFGIQHIQISINYLGEQIEKRFGDGSDKGVAISYIREKSALGTIGSLTMANPFNNDVVLVMNSDLLTNIDFGDFYQEFLKSGADLAVATTPHHVDLPYGIVEFEGQQVSALREKPRYTFFANAGIYLIKREVLKHIPSDTFYDATDLMDTLLQKGNSVVHFPILGYWTDIGRVEDYRKAQDDIKFISW